MNPKYPVKIKVMHYMMTDGEGRFIKISPTLKVVGFGKSPEDAIKDFEISIRNFFDFHGKKNTLHAKLIESGYILIDSDLSPPESVDIPTEASAGSRVVKFGVESFASC